MNHPLSWVEDNRVRSTIYSRPPPFIKQNVTHTVYFHPLFPALPSYIHTCFQALQEDDHEILLRNVASS